MAIARVQAKDAEGTGGATSIVVTPTSATTTGNLLTVIIRTAAATITSLTGTGYSFTSAVSDTTQNPHLFGYYAKNITGGSNAITAQLSSAEDFSWMQVVEWSGADTTAPLDITDNKTGSGVTDCVSNSIATAAQAGMIVLGCSQPAFTTYTQGTGYTLDAGNLPTGGSNHYGGTEYQITSGSVSGAQHITSGVTNAYTIVLMSFKASGGGGGGTRGLFRPHPYGVGIGGAFFRDPLQG